MRANLRQAMAAANRQLLATQLAVCTQFARARELRTAPRMHDRAA
jgi:hypothetical protein